MSEVANGRETMPQDDPSMQSSGDDMASEMRHSLEDIRPQFNEDVARARAGTLRSAFIGHELNSASSPALSAMATPSHPTQSPALTSRDRPTTSLTNSAVRGRRQRRPRKFVVTDVPDDESFSPQTSPPPEAHSTKTEASDSTIKRRTEKRGRFMITDLSSNMEEASTPTTTEIPPPPPIRRTTLRRRSSFRSANSLAGMDRPRESPAGESDKHRRPEPLPSPSNQTHRVDLSVFDRQLLFLQRESAQMKSLLDGMVSTNARYIEALCQTGSTLSSLSPSGLSELSVSDLTASSEQQAGGHTREDKSVRLQNAYAELEQKYSDLMRNYDQVRERNRKLTTRLEQEMSVNEELRSQLAQLTQYTESLVAESDMASVVDVTSSIGLDETFPPHEPAETPSKRSEPEDNNAHETVKATEQKRQRPEKTGALDSLMDSQMNELSSSLHRPDSKFGGTNQETRGWGTYYPNNYSTLPSSSSSSLAAFGRQVASMHPSAYYGPQPSYLHPRGQGGNQASGNPLFQNDPFDAISTSSSNTDRALPSVFTSANSTADVAGST